MLDFRMCLNSKRSSPAGWKATATVAKATRSAKMLLIFLQFVMLHWMYWLGKSSWMMDDEIESGQIRSLDLILACSTFSWNVVLEKVLCGQKGGVRLLSSENNQFIELLTKFLLLLLNSIRFKEMKNLVGIGSWSIRIDHHKWNSKARSDKCKNHFNL